jgi:DNA-binding response OmpR family regulator
VQHRNSGADDYPVKGLKRAETLARISALLRGALPVTAER